jgi:hypothetical protein
VLLVSKDNRARFVGGKGCAEAMALVEKGQLFFHRLDKQQGLLTSHQVSCWTAATVMSRRMPYPAGYLLLMPPPYRDG